MSQWALMTINSIYHMRTAQRPPDLFVLQSSACLASVRTLALSTSHSCDLRVIMQSRGASYGKACGMHDPRSVRSGARSRLTEAVHSYEAPQFWLTALSGAPACWHIGFQICQKAGIWQTAPLHCLGTTFSRHGPSGMRSFPQFDFFEKPTDETLEQDRKRSRFPCF